MANFEARLQPVDLVHGNPTGCDELYMFAMVPGDP